MNDMKTIEAPRMMTIRSVAKLGVLPEFALRRGVREGWCPGIRVGNRYLINVDKLIEYLNGQSDQQ